MRHKCGLSDQFDLLDSQSSRTSSGFSSQAGSPAQSTMENTIKPVIIIVTGAWHVPEHYGGLSNRLRHRGFTVECPLLETNCNAGSPTQSIDDDIDQIRQLAIFHLASGHNIIAIVHSYGGMVGSHAFAGMSQYDAQYPAYVQNLIYMSAFVPMQNESLAGIFGGQLPPWIVSDGEQLTVDGPGELFYNDMNEDDAREAVSKLVLHPSRAQFDPPTHSEAHIAWEHIPVTYIYCQKDKALVIPAQEMMVQRLQERNPSITVQKEFCDAGHSPFLSQPEKLVEIVMKLVQNHGSGW